jgi:hypothetical protein
VDVEREMDRSVAAHDAAGEGTEAGEERRERADEDLLGGPHGVDADGEKLVAAEIEIDHQRRAVGVAGLEHGAEMRHAFGIGSVVEANAFRVIGGDGVLETVGGDPQDGGEAALDGDVDARLEAEMMTAREADRAAELLDRREGDVEPDAAAREQIGAVRTRGEAGEEKELEERLIIGGMSARIRIIFQSPASFAIQTLRCTRPWSGWSNQA